MKPQLIDTTDTPGWLAAVATLLIRSDSDWLLASTRTIWAPGAMACDPFHVERLFHFPLPPRSGPSPGRDVVWPSWLSTVRNDEAGPYC